MPENLGRLNETELNFNILEWHGLVVAGDASAAVSFTANTIVLIIHAFMLWYRPVVVARLSLRMIVLSCIFNMIYCVGQLVADGIPSFYYSCRVLIYVLIVSDTMACMCLAMVGLNLVMIFVLKVSRSIKLEIIYYIIIAVCGVLVAVVPIAVNKRILPSEGSTCWYHYYFDGRLHALFNWIWYYSWLLFSSAFAALCAVISLAFVVQKQGHLAGRLDMFSFRDKDQVSKIQRLKRYSNNNTDVFKKIARRCILYPLVPLVSKAWGIAIVVTAARDGKVPYSIFVIDRIFSCLLGVMVSSIYFTDPALSVVFKEGIENLKKRYVYDYYSVRYQPDSDPTIKSNSGYPQRIKIVKGSNTHSTSSLRHSVSFNRTSTYREETVTSPIFYTTANIGTSNRESIIGTHHTTISNFQTHMGDARRPSVSFKEKVASVEVRKPSDASSKDQKHFSERKFSVVSVTSTSGKTFLPNDEFLDNNMPAWTNLFHCFEKGNIYKIPMHSISDDKNTKNERKTTISNLDANSQLEEDIETIVPFKYPCGAKLLHWTLVSIFKVSSTKRRKSIDKENTAPTRVFRDFTDNSNPTSPEITGAHTNNTSPTSATSPNIYNTESKFKSSLPTNKSITNIGGKRKRLTLSPVESLDLIRSEEHDSDDSCEHFPIRKASTINVGGLSQEERSPVSRASFNGGGSVKDLRTSSSNSSSRFASSFGLVKMLNRGRSMSINLGKFSRSSKKMNEPSSPSSSHSLTVRNSIPMEELVENTNTESMMQIRPGEKIDEYSFQRDNQVTAVVEKPDSIRSHESIKPPFPAELSPRPIVKHERKGDGTASKLCLSSSSKIKSSIPNSIYHVEQRLSIFGEDTVSFDTPNEELHNSQEDLERNISSDGIITNITDERPTSMNTESTRFDDYGKRLSLLSLPEVGDDRDGLSQGFTTVNFISSWQDHDSDDTTRITVHSEVWDIDEQFRAQVELAEAMEHI